MAVIGQLLLCYSPGEVAVGLLETSLAQAMHHRRTGEGFCQEDYVRVLGIHGSDALLPEVKRLCVRIIDTEGAYSLTYPEFNNT